MYYTLCKEANEKIDFPGGAEVTLSGIAFVRNMWDRLPHPLVLVVNVRHPLLVIRSHMSNYDSLDVPIKRDMLMDVYPEIYNYDNELQRVCDYVVNWTNMSINCLERVNPEHRLIHKVEELDLTSIVQMLGYGCIKDAGIISAQQRVKAKMLNKKVRKYDHLTFKDLPGNAQEQIIRLRYPKEV